MSLSGAIEATGDDPAKPNRVDLEDLIVRLRTQADELEAIVVLIWPPPLLH